MSTKKPSLRGSPGARWGLSGGVIASLCCVGPTVAALFGLTGATFLFSLLRYRPYFLAAGVVFMVAGIGLALRRSRQVCDIAQHRRNLWLFPSVALLSFGISYGVLTYVTPTLVYRSLRPMASASQPAQAADAKSTRSRPAATVPATEAAPAAVTPQEAEAPAGAPARPHRATLAIQGMS